MKFYLESLDDLINGIEDQKTSLASHRSKWAKRVGSLTTKAVEDYYLLVGEKGATSVDGAFKRTDLRTPR